MHSIKTILESVEGLPKQMVESLETAFNEQIEAKTESIRAELTAENEAVLKEAKLDQIESIVESVDAFLDSQIGVWVEANAVGIDQMIKTQIAESLITTVVGALAEHDIARPEVSHVVESIENRYQEQRNRSNSLLKENVKLKNENSQLKAKAVVEAVIQTADLALNEAEQLIERASKIAFINESDYRGQLETQLYALKAEAAKKSAAEGDKGDQGKDAEDDDMDDDEDDMDEGYKKESFEDDAYRQEFIKSISG